MGANTRSDTEELVATAFRETVGAGDTEAVSEYFADTVKYHRSSGELGGKRELLEDVEMFHAAFPDLSANIRQIMSQDDTVSFIYTLTGTHEGEFEGIPPTRREMEAKGAALIRTDGSQITEYRIVFDNLGMLEQLGVIAE
jgi:steroid delta-isomerase-like uncharacterized protein